MKHNHSALSYGDYTQIGITNTACIYQRQDEKECLWICMNMKNEAQTLGFNGQGNFIDIETNEEVPVNNALEFKPYEVRILKKIERLKSLDFAYVFSCFLVVRNSYE